MLVQKDATKIGWGTLQIPPGFTNCPMKSGFHDTSFQLIACQYPQWPLYICKVTKMTSVLVFLHNRTGINPASHLPHFYLEAAECCHREGHNCADWPHYNSCFWTLYSFAVLLPLLCLTAATSHDTHPAIKTFFLNSQNVETTQMSINFFQKYINWWMD